MKVEKTYIADDGKRFDDENECIKYENELKQKAKNEILQEIKDLDLAIWKKYHPDYECGDEPELYHIQNFFETMGKRYGLLREFKENCIC